jgi:hypothetical protein
MEYTKFNDLSKDILYACVGEAHVKCTQSGKTYDPLLKLYHGRPLMININLDVKKCIANGTTCEFLGVVLKEGVAKEDLELIVMDKFFVRCVEVTQIDSLKVRILDGVDSDEDIRIAYLKPQETQGACVHFPMPLYEKSINPPKDSSAASDWNSSLSTQPMLGRFTNCKAGPWKPC